MMRNLETSALAAVLLCVMASAGAQRLPLFQHPKVTVPGGRGRFDYMLVDPATRRLYATHKGTGRLAVLDLKTGIVLPSPHVGKTQGVAIDATDGRVLLGAEEGSVLSLNRTTLAPVGSTSLPGPVDDIALDTRNGLVYADHDDGAEVWVVRASTMQRVADIPVAGAPEFIEYDRPSNRLYQNIKANDTVLVIDPESNTVTSVWRTAPATSPHGLAVDHARGRLFSAGADGILVEFNLFTGRLIASAPIPKGADQIAFDPHTRRVYCACAGWFGVVQETDGGLKPLPSVPAPAGSHTLAVDPKTHAVWTTGTDANGSFFEEFTPQ
ncbi:MAG: hypothetical protein KGJ62_13760 [Armatimonadetes bacterium]|nr:hypothetical protein [Armatimonadota bacterium]MDE2207633.1 hypothetical protein [Armatimonadota bacterium]